VCRSKNLRKKVKEVGGVVKYLKPEFLDEVAESCVLEDVGWQALSNSAVQRTASHHARAPVSDHERYGISENEALMGCAPATVNAFSSRQARSGMIGKIR
jgi:hypothetical protein